MILAVTGGTGFVGGRLIELATARGHTVRALARRAQPPRDGVTWVDGTLGDAAALDPLVDGADAVIHVAGVVNAPDRAGFEHGNIAGTRSMVDAATRAGVRRFVHVSSLAAREPALSNYGWSKAGAENAVVTSPLDWTVVRPPGIYGPRDTEMRELFRMAARGVVLLPPPGRLSVIHVDDLARLLIALAEQDAGRHIFEVDDATPGAWTYADFARALGRAVGRRHVLPLSVPRAILALAARADRLVRGANAKLTADRVGYMCHPDWTADPTRYPPRSLWTPAIDTEAGLRDTAAAYRATGAL